MYSDASAQEKLENFERLYEEFAGKPPAPKAPLGLSQGWIGQQPGVFDSSADDFLESVTRSLEELREEIAQVPDGSDRDALACRAIRIMVTPRQTDQNDSRELCVHAAQRHGGILAPFLSAESKKELRGLLKRSTQGCGLLPSQRELLKALGN